jgi:hypothetical protein
MAETIEPPSGDGFEFVPEYANLIAHANNHWNYLEYDVNASIWALANVSPAFGACMTSQIYTMHARLNALLSLLKIRKADERILKKVNRFAERVREVQEARNRTAHDIWLIDRLNPGKMGKLRITAEKTLKFGVQGVDLSELKADIEKLNMRREEFFAIRREIEAALPTLPEIPQTELHPIVETRSPRQNPASD